MGIFDRLREALTLAPQDEADRALEIARQQMHELREEALQIARGQATARGGEHEPINLQDYYRAAQSVMERANAELSEGATPYNIQQFGDMRGHTLENFQFRQEDLDIITSDDDPLGLNLEERGLSFSLSGSTLSNVSFIPATTFNSLGIDNTGDITIDNAIFHGMGSGQVLHLAAGTYNNISVVHDANAFPGMNAELETNGAVIQLEQNARVDGINVRGMTVELHLAPRSALIDLDTEGARVLRFHARGALVQNAHLNGNVIAETSNMTGMQWQESTFTNVNMQGVDFSGSRFTNCGFTFGDNSADEPFNDVNFSGVRFDNVTLTRDGVARPITFEDLIEMGVEPNQLPTIGGQTYAQYQVAQLENSAPAPTQAATYTPGSAQEMVARIMEMRGNLVMAVADEAPDGYTNINATLPVTQEALNQKAADNAAWMDANVSLPGSDA